MEAIVYMEPRRPVKIVAEKPRGIVQKIGGIPSTVFFKNFVDATEFVKWVMDFDRTIKTTVIVDVVESCKAGEYDACMFKRMYEDIVCNGYPIMVKII